MFTMDWLVARVRTHLAPACDADVFLATHSGEVIGHTIVRLETDEGETFGLFSTVYVAPEHRRSNVAGALLEKGEQWMGARGMTRAATNTARTNDKLFRLFEKRGYAIVLHVGEMVHLSRAL